MSMLTPVLQPPEVKEYLSKGERFIKWDDETANASPVILRVDPKGFYLYWTYQNKEMEILDITSIRDTRVGRFAKIPKCQKLREVFNLDYPHSTFLLKTLTIVSGPDMVDLTFHNFVSYKENVGKSWAEDIMAIVRNPLTYNASRYTFLEKILVKLKMQLNAEGKIPVKNIFQMFPADRKRVEAALSACHLPKGKNDAINPEDFPETVYKTFLMNLCPRPEIDEIFTSHHLKAKPYMTKEHLAKFINKKQRDSRLNDILFPPAKPEQVQSLIEKYEPSGINIQRGQLSPEGMVWFLCGPENNVIALDKLVLYQDMTQPLSHYFINSSHNTYLTAGQFSGISSPEMYRQTLLAGCRCVELDCWKGRPPDEEPIITHGFTMTTEILFKDAIEAIAESAFKTSLYPVILSFENHVDSPKQQAKMAEYCRTIFGDMLLTEPLEKYPLKPGVPLPSPKDLLGKILIKNKKKQSVSGKRQNSLKKGRNVEPEVIGQPAPMDAEDTGDVAEEEPEEEDEQLGNLDEEEIKKMQSDEGTAGLEVTAYEEMSSLVNYIQPIKFDSFEVSAQKNRSYVISSFTELKAYDLLTKFPMQFSKCRYNKRQMSRIYPKGTRMDSSNYMPQMFWNVGCQMVALNFQTMDVPMQQNMALFEFNGQCGYLLKHEFMRRPDKPFDPFSVDRIDVILSGQFLSDRSVKTYVEVELFGLPRDTKRKYRTKLTSTANSINPVWKEEPFVFEKIMMPELASLKIVAYEEGGKFIGHRVIPIIAVHSGYHHVCLRSESNMPLTMPSLFVYLEVKDYVPDAWADLTIALSNPIKFFSLQDKKSVKLKDGSVERLDMQRNFPSAESNGIPDSSGKFTTPFANGPAEPQTASLAELQQMKLFLKLLKKQEKELKELERKGSKRREELLQKYSALFSEPIYHGGKKRAIHSRKTQKKRSLTIADVDTTCANPVVMAESIDSQVLELKERLKMDLIQLGEEHYDGIRRRKEQHATEQVTKITELAKEKQTAELKALKESSESNIKDIKKKLEAKRVDRIQAMMRNTSDKAAQERLKKEINNSHIQEVVQTIKLVIEKTARYQRKLEEKQADNLRAIKEKESQLQQEAVAEYEEKLKSLNAEVQEIMKNCAKVVFPEEPEMWNEAVLSIPKEEQHSTEQLEKKIPVAEVSRLTIAMPEPPETETDSNIEERTSVCAWGETTENKTLLYIILDLQLSRFAATICLSTSYPETLALNPSMHLAIQATFCCANTELQTIAVLAVPNCSSYSLAPYFYTGELAVEIKDGVRNGISTRGEAAFPVKTQSRATAITATWAEVETTLKLKPVIPCSKKCLFQNPGLLLQPFLVLKATQTQNSIPKALPHIYLRAALLGPSCEKGLRRKAAWKLQTGTSFLRASIPNSTWSGSRVSILSKKSLRTGEVCEKATNPKIQQISCSTLTWTAGRQEDGQRPVDPEVCWKPAVEQSKTMNSSGSHSSRWGRLTHQVTSHYQDCFPNQPLAVSSSLHPLRQRRSKEVPQETCSSKTVFTASSAGNSWYGCFTVIIIRLTSALPLFQTTLIWGHGNDNSSNPCQQRKAHSTETLGRSFLWSSLCQFTALEDCSAAGGRQRTPPLYVYLIKKELPALLLSQQCPGIALVHYHPKGSFELLMSHNHWVLTGQLPFHRRVLGKDGCYALRTSKIQQGLCSQRARYQLMHKTNKQTHPTHAHRTSSLLKSIPTLPPKLRGNLSCREFENPLSLWSSDLSIHKKKGFLPKLHRISSLFWEKHNQPEQLRMARAARQLRRATCHITGLQPISDELGREEKKKKFLYNLEQAKGHNSHASSHMFV
ncbi:1-phosphatidylinositol 4,5-bisphosphate phosphodiesterase beta-2 isoform X2 [Aix galericulata]|nr:1-phosphatidylinositol 4,5-bisphosphate phosphodiesterase beta-2 isoform X2 [Aix galericulata]